MEQRFDRMKPPVNDQYLPSSATPADRDKLYAACPHLRSENLFAGGKLVVIHHAGREYQLRVTAANKLILTA